MRWWPRLVVLTIALSIILVSFTFWTRCGEERAASSHEATARQAKDPPSAQLEEGGVNPDGGLSDLRCLINEEYSVECKAGKDEVYFPFSFLKKYFEMYGEMGEERGGKVFRWSHSYGKVFPPSEPYQPAGGFMYFGSYNVERRDRVKCVSGPHGVPVTTQWLPSGFYYPIQIAQFGLAHFSRNLTEPPPRRMLLLPGKADPAGLLKTVRDADLNEEVTEFATPRHSPATLKLDSAGKQILIFDLKLTGNASITVDLLFRDSSAKNVRVHYVCSDRLLATRDTDVYVGLGRHWDGYKHFIRDLSVDAYKGLTSRGRGSGQKITPQRMRVQAVHVAGSGRLRQLSLASSDHMGQFLQAADWLLASQTASGAWTIPVERRLNDRMVLKPNWCSAMGQGQAMSLLTRAFRVTGDRRYLEAARRATNAFTVASKDGGVRTLFQDKYVWYEEYPTVPASLVLNGFIYSLMGLYDLSQTSGGGAEAGQLYREGIASLRALLPLFDTGSGTLYDLRHVTSHVAPNLARWDYHVTHVNQLLVLATIEKEEPIFSQVADRWTEYMHGHRAPHN